MKALVVIDIQMGFMNEHTEYLEKKIADFIDSNKEKFGIIIGTKYINHLGTACYKFENWKSCMENTFDTYFAPKISPRVNMVFEKDKYSCWNQEFKDFVKQKGIDEIYLCGVNTGCCVLHSAFDIYNDVISCYVIEDLCGSTSGKQSHECALQVLRECITKDRVITSSVI